MQWDKDYHKTDITLSTRIYTQFNQIKTVVTNIEFYNKSNESFDYTTLTVSSLSFWWNTYNARAEYTYTYTYTIDSRYIAVIYDTIMHTAQQFQW